MITRRRVVRITVPVSVPTPERHKRERCVIRIAEREAHPEGIGIAERKADSKVRVRVPVAVLGRVVRRVDDIRGDVVIEFIPARHVVHNLEQTGERIVLHALVGAAERGEVPVTVAGQLVERERVGRVGGEDGARSTFIVDLQRLPVGATPQFEVSLATNEVVLARIDWEQHPNPAEWVGMQNDHVAIAVGSDVDPRAVTDVVCLVIQPDDNGRIVDPCERGGGGGGNYRCSSQQQREQHMSNIPPEPLCCSRHFTMRQRTPSPEPLS